jgi:tRNA pseudouridine13 synthase
MADGMTLQNAVVGDVFCFAKGGLPDMDRQQAVTPENLPAIDRLARRGRAFLTLPLIGFETNIEAGAQGEIERSILRDEGILPENFRVPENPDLGSRGTRRAALCQVKPKIEIEENLAKLQFSLPKGSYATVVLREYMKSLDNTDAHSINDLAEE